MGRACVRGLTSETAVVIRLGVGDIGASGVLRLIDVLIAIAPKTGHDNDG